MVTKNFRLNNNVNTEYYSNNNYTSHHNDNVHYQSKMLITSLFLAIIDDNDYVVYNNALNGYKYCNEQESNGSTYIVKKTTNIFALMMAA